MPNDPHITTADRELHLEGSTVVLTNSSFPINPIWDALEALYGDPYKPIDVIDSLRAAKAITDTADPVWDEVYALYGDTFEPPPGAVLEVPEEPVDADELELTDGEEGADLSDLAGLPDDAGSGDGDREVETGGGDGIPDAAGDDPSTTDSLDAVDSAGLDPGHGDGGTS